MASNSDRGCVLICEPDPPPGALLGRMAFGGFNPEAEKLQVYNLDHATTLVTCLNHVWHACVALYYILLILPIIVSAFCV